MEKAYLYSHIPYYLNSAIVLIFIYVTEFYHRPFSILWIVYSLFPILDQIIPNNNINPSPEDEKILSKQWKWKIPIYLFILMEWVTLLWAFSYITRFELSVSEFLVFMLAVSHVSALGFLFSHELFHKRDTLGKVVGTFDLLKSLYMHFYLEHLYGHHKYVSTPKDPATAKYGQSLYGFIPQSLKGGFVNSWNREAGLLTKQGKQTWSFSNRMIQWVLIELLFSLGVWILFGNLCFVFFISQAFLSVSLLETINYVRHYGLQRKKLPNGEYEPVTIKHSWNAPQTMQNIVLLNLQRHSDHHANSYKPYQILQSCENSPNLPCGYAVCVLASFVPWVWFSIVNPLAAATNQDGKPSPSQMEKSSNALRLWLLIQVSVITALSFIFK